MTVRNLYKHIHKHGPRWAKLTIALSAAVMLSSYAPLPSLIDQIKTLGELRVVTRTGPLAFYRGPDGTPMGPEYELARRFADQLGVKLKITSMRSYPEIYAALTSGSAHLAAAGLKIPPQSIPGVDFGPVYQHVREHLIYRRGAALPGSLAEIGNADLEIAAGSSYAKSLENERGSLPDLVWGRKFQHQLPGAARRQWPTAASITRLRIQPNSLWRTLRIPICASRLISREAVHWQGRHATAIRASRTPWQFISRVSMAMANSPRS